MMASSRAEWREGVYDSYDRLDELLKKVKSS